MSSCPIQASNPSGSQRGQDSQNREQTRNFCTRKCLLGLRLNDLLDTNCPNVDLHRVREDDIRHPFTAKDFTRQLNDQVNQQTDVNCTPYGACRDCGASGAPFKVTRARYRYTLLGKGATDHLWKSVKLVAEVYRILR